LEIIEAPVPLLPHGSVFPNDTSLVSQYHHVQFTWHHRNITIFLWLFTNTIKSSSDLLYLDAVPWHERGGGKEGVSRDIAILWQSAYTEDECGMLTARRELREG
jgi:hypothetical protein